MATIPISFGVLLRTLRKRAGMTQGDLAAAVGYSVSAISALEQERRLPDVTFVMQHLLPALAVSDAPQLATRLIELAAAARGERPPTSLTIQRSTQVVIQEEVVESPGHLFASPTILIGRTAQVHQLCDRLLGHGGRVLTLVGPPGIGKTTLALAVATQVQPHYRDGAVFVALAAITESVLMAATIATAVGCSDASPKPPQVRLIEFLRRKTMLLVLDNLEQIREAAPLIAELVAECPGICVLATSRERLHLRAEQRYQVSPLSLVAAVELFTLRAQAIAATFALTLANQATIEAICERLDRLPLAIELCAAQIDLLSPAQLLAHLQTRPLDLLVEGAHDLSPRQRTLRTAIGHSYALLDDVERTLLRSLGVFVGGFDLPAVEAVVADNLRAAVRPLAFLLHALIGKSLVRAETLPNGEQRFLLLETIREFALEQLRAHGEEALLRERHYAAYLHLFRTGDSYLRRAEAATWLARLEPELGNLRAALRWALDAERYADVTWLMNAAGWFWRMCGYWEENNRWLAQVAPHRHLLDTNLRLTIVMNAYGAAGAWEEFQPFERWSEEMMQLLALCSNKVLQAAVWFFIAGFSPDFSPAAWERAIAFARAAQQAPGPGADFGAIGDCDFILASCLEDYANALIKRGELALAASLIQESLAIYRQWGNHYQMAIGPGALGTIALLQGDLPQAHKLLHEAVTIATAFKIQGMLGTWQPPLGIIALYRGDSAEARRLLNESLRIWLELNDKNALAWVSAYLAETALWEGGLAEAERWLAQSLTYHVDPRRITVEEVQRLWVAARLAAAQQQYPRAATLFGLADQIHRQVYYVVAGPMRALADAALATVQAALEPAVFAEAFASGQRVSLAEAFATVLVPEAGAVSLHAP